MIHMLHALFPNFQWYFFHVLIEHCKQTLNSEDPDQTPYCAVSDLGLHCLSISHRKDARFIHYMG